MDEEWLLEVIADLLISCERRLRLRSYGVIREGDDKRVDGFRRKGKEELHPALKWGL
jgi:hypothetical protein